MQRLALRSTISAVAMAQPCLVFRMHKSTQMSCIESKRANQPQVDASLASVLRFAQCKDYQRQDSSGSLVGSYWSVSMIQQLVTSLNSSSSRVFAAR